MRVCPSCGCNHTCAFVCSRVIGCSSLPIPGATSKLIQSAVEVASGITDGQVTSITVNSGGSFYLAQPTVTITGDGTGATAVAILNWTSKTVSAIFVTNFGTGYSHATVTISAPGGVGATATATAVLTGQVCLGFVATGSTTVAVTAPTLTEPFHYADNSGSTTLTCNSITFATTLVPISTYVCVSACVYPRSKLLTLATTAGSCTLTWILGQTWTGSITLTGQSVPTWDAGLNKFDCTNLTSQSVKVSFVYAAGTIQQAWFIVECCVGLGSHSDQNLTAPDDVNIGSNKLAAQANVSLTLCPGPDPFLQSGTFPSTGSNPGFCTPLPLTPIPGPFTITL